MIALSMMREPSIDLIVFMDSEGGGVTKEFAQFLGIDPHKILYSQVDTVEELISRMKLTIDIIEKNKSKKNVLILGVFCTILLILVEYGLSVAECGL